MRKKWLRKRAVAIALALTLVFGGAPATNIAEATSPTSATETEDPYAWMDDVNDEDFKATYGVTKEEYKKAAETEEKEEEVTYTFTRGNAISGISYESFYFSSEIREKDSIYLDGNIQTDNLTFTAYESVTDSKLLKAAYYAPSQKGASESDILAVLDKEIPTATGTDAVDQVKVRDAIYSLYLRWVFDKTITLTDEQKTVVSSIDRIVSSKPEVNPNLFHAYIYKNEDITLLRSGEDVLPDLIEKTTPEATPTATSTDATPSDAKKEETKEEPLTKEEQKEKDKEDQEVKTRNKNAQQLMSLVAETTAVASAGTRTFYKSTIYSDLGYHFFATSSGAGSGNCDAFCIEPKDDDPTTSTTYSYGVTETNRDIRQAVFYCYGAPGYVAMDLAHNTAYQNALHAVEEDMINFLSDHSYTENQAGSDYIAGQKLIAFAAAGKTNNGNDTWQNRSNNLSYNKIKALWDIVSALPDPSSTGFTVYRHTPTDNAYQTMLSYDQGQSAVRICKSPLKANGSVMTEAELVTYLGSSYASDPYTSLVGAKYAVSYSKTTDANGFLTPNVTITITADNGKTDNVTDFVQVESGRAFWIQEIQAPTSGKFQLNKTVYGGNTGFTVAKGKDLTIGVTDVDLPQNGLHLRDTTVIGDTGEPAKMTITKASAIPAMTNSNPCYNPTGIEYTVYKVSSATDKSTSNPVGKFTVDNSNFHITATATGTGVTASGSVLTVPLGYYFTKETKGSNDGTYLIDTGRDGQWNLDATRPNTNGAAYVKNFTDKPNHDPVVITIQKVNSENRPVTGNFATLEGAEYTIKYYAGQYATPASVPATATRTWVIKTIEKTDSSTGTVTYEADLSNPRCIVTSKSDDLYREGTRVILPIGTITVQETKAPEGYNINNEVMLANITSNQQGEIHFSQNHTYTSTEQVTRADFSFTKLNYVTRTTMPKIPFRITALTEDTNGNLIPGTESHIIVTDEDGYFSTKTIPNTLNTNGNDTATDFENLNQTGIWFGDIADVDNAKSALPYGWYRIEELPCSRNAGMQMYTLDFEVTTEGQVRNLPVANVPTPFITTQAQSPVTLSSICLADTNAEMNDIVEWNWLTAGKTYTLRGTIRNLDNLDEHGVPRVVAAAPDTTFTVPDTYNLTPQEKCGTTTVSFTFDSTAVAGDKMVIYEELYDDAGNLVAEHKDPTDTSQQFTIPDIKTTALTTDTNTHSHIAGLPVTIEDTVEYKGLKVGSEYRVTGELMSKTRVDANGNPTPVLNADGTPVTASTFFIAPSVDGSIKLRFTYNSVDYEDDAVVVFEHLYWNGREYAVHADINDEGQSIHHPKLRTTALTDDGIHMAMAKGTVNVTDTVAYSNVSPLDEGYHIYGKLMNLDDKNPDGTLKPLLVDGREIKADKFLVPTATNGTIDMTFTFDASKLEGVRAVVYEDCYVLKNGKETLVSSENNPNNKDQYIYFPKVRTNAVDSQTNGHTANPDEVVTINDVVSYSSLISGKQYTVKGKVYVKETGRPLLDEQGQEITAEKTFTAPGEKGTVTLSFTFNASLLKLKGKSTVIFEDLYDETGTIHIATHSDLNDKDQTTGFPDFKTTAHNTGGKGHLILVEEKATLVDTIHYTNLAVGESFTAVGTLVDTTTGKPILVNGKEVTAKKKFVPDKPNGDVDVTFTFDATGLGDSNGVVFEKIYAANGKLIGSHEDKNDKEQWFYFPDAKTKARDLEDGDKFITVRPDKTAQIVDTITFTNLIPNEEYTAEGHLMSLSVLDKDGKSTPVLKDGKEVTATTTFKPTTKNGTVDVVFTVDCSAIEDSTIVVHEYVLDYTGTVVAKHTDDKDDDQTIRVPKLRTKARDGKDGDKVIAKSGSVTVVDTCSYTNLIVGKEYEIKGRLMDSKTGAPIVIDGKPVTAEMKFKAEIPNGSIDLAFTFDAAKLPTYNLVVFEGLYDTETKHVIAVHEDKDDKDQQVDSGEVQTGDTAPIILFIVFTMMSVMGIILVAYKRRRMVKFEWPNK